MFIISRVVAIMSLILYSRGITVYINIDLYGCHFDCRDIILQFMYTWETYRVHWDISYSWSFTYMYIYGSLNCLWVFIYYILRRKEAWKSSLVLNKACAILLKLLFLMNAWSMSLWKTISKDRNSEMQSKSFKDESIYSIF